MGEERGSGEEEDGSGWMGAYAPVEVNLLPGSKSRARATPRGKPLARGQKREWRKKGAPGRLEKLPGALILVEESEEGEGRRERREEGGR